MVKRMHRNIVMWLNQSLDGLVCPDIRILGSPRSAFTLCGVSGVVLAVALTAALWGHMDLRWWVALSLVLSSVLTFFALAMATNIVVGRERHVYFHYQIAVLLVAIGVLRLMQQPVLPYLDGIALWLSAILSGGRVGCLMAGCCHGRPHRWGVCYRDEHAAAGFTRYLVGVRLFPVQAVESLWALFIVITGSLMLIEGQPAGSVFGWYVAAQGVGRFLLEFLRGDSERPYIRGLSEAQWTAAGLVTLIAVAELTGLLPLQGWHVGVAACLVLAVCMIATVDSSSRTARRRLLHTGHIREIAEAIEALSRLDDAAQAKTAEVPICRTSLGLLISGGRDGDAVDSINHYTLSYQNEVMDEKTAEILAELICRLKRSPESSELFRGRHTVYHVLIHPPCLDGLHSPG